MADQQWQSPFHSMAQRRAGPGLSSDPDVTAHSYSKTSRQFKSEKPLGRDCLGCGIVLVFLGILAFPYLLFYSALFSPAALSVPAFQDKLPSHQAVQQQKQAEQEAQVRRNRHYPPQPPVFVSVSAFEFHEIFIFV